jgi:hypothetical protein
MKGAKNGSQYTTLVVYRMQGTGECFRPNPHALVKRFNARRVKIHRSYAVDEAARVLRSHKNTVRNWLGLGLHTVDSNRPILIRGADLRDFLTARRLRSKKRCAPGELYCVRCRSPKEPAGGVAEYRPITATSGNLKGTCPNCGIPIFRRVSLASLDRASGSLTIQLPQAQRPITDCAVPSVICDLKPNAETDANS